MRKIKIESLMFDLDGTLVDSRKDIVSAVNFTIRSLGLKEKSFDEIISFVGGGIGNLIRKSLNTDDGPEYEKALKLFRDYYLEHAVDESEFYPDVIETLKYFQNKKIFVVSNKKTELTLKSLSLLNIDGLFRDVIGGENDESCLKPSPCQIEKLRKTHNLQKQNVLMVGDMDTDIIAGKAAGVRTCGVTYGFSKEEDIVKANPDYVINGLLNLKGIVG